MVEATKNRIRILAAAASSAALPLSEISANGAGLGLEASLRELSQYRCGSEGEQNKRCEIILPQSVYRAVVDHLSQDTNREHGGFLLGYETTLGDAGAPVLVITEAIAAKFTEGTPVKLVFTTDSWRSLDDEIAAKYRNAAHVPQRVGWYHSHPNISIFLSHWDLDVCTTFDRRKYPVALVVDPVRKQGGFFVGGSQGYLPHSPQDFYEVHNMQKEPMVEWVNVTRANKPITKPESESAAKAVPIARDTPEQRRAARARELASALAIAIMAAGIAYLC